MRLQRKEVEALVETAEEWKPPSKGKKGEKVPKGLLRDLTWGWREINRSKTEWKDMYE